MSSDKHVVLYIDDDEDFLDTVGQILEAAGFEAIRARTAEEGLAAYRQSNPDLILVDLMMEEVDAGTSLVRELERLQNTAPVYMISSLGDTLNLTLDVAGLGLAGVFQKPVDGLALIATLRARLEQRTQD
jgi:DNA-binding response OmpR family regulator